MPAPMIEAWREEGCLITVAASLGSRPCLCRVVVPFVVVAREPLVVSISLCNFEWARDFGLATVRLWLQHQGSGRQIEGDLGDLCDLSPQATGDSVWSAALPIGADALPGGDFVLLGAPDGFPATRDDPRYAIRVDNGVLKAGALATPGWPSLSLSVEIRSRDAVVSHCCLPEQISAGF